MQDSHFDELMGMNFDMPDQETKEGVRIDYLIHRVFQQNKDGAELLRLWEGALIRQPTVVSGGDMFGAGINEGLKTFIRNILITVEKIENE